jgi:hypothetical protein
MLPVGGFLKRCMDAIEIVDLDAPFSLALSRIAVSTANKKENYVVSFICIFLAGLFAFLGRVLNGPVAGSHQFSVAARIVKSTPETLLLTYSYLKSNSPPCRVSVRLSRQ